MRKSFKEIYEYNDLMLENAKAMEGNWEEGVVYLGSQGEEGMKNWDLLEELNSSLIPNIPNNHTYLFYQLKNDFIFKIGYWDKEKIPTKLGVEERPIFREVFRMDLYRYISLEKETKYKKLVNVDSVIVDKSLSNIGIATFIYKYLVNTLHYTILGGDEQYYGARRLWSRLSKELDVQVDIIDINTKEVIYENTILHHGKYDSDFDKRVWDYSDNKNHLRTILTKIL